MSHGEVNDFARIRDALNDLNDADEDLSWAAFNWIFRSSELDEEGFYQTAKRAGANPSRLTDGLLISSGNARKFFYGETSKDEPLHR